MGVATGTATIVDDDPVPTLNVGDVTVTEGDSGSVNATFTVAVSAPSGRTVTVGYVDERTGRRPRAAITRRRPER